MPKRYLQRRMACLLVALVSSWMATVVVAMSERKEQEIGDQMYAEILQTMPIYRDEALQTYVQTIGRELAKKSARPELEYTFTLIDSNDINAFATPGGYVYINRGLLAYMTTEAQLAAVLGHEIGHIAAYHASRQQTAGTAAAVASGILAVFTAYQTGSSAAAGAVNDATSFAGTALVRGYGRDMELAADELGASYLAKTGYDPQAMVEVIGILKDHESFSRLKAKESGQQTQGYHGLFSTHPRNDERLQNVVKNAGDGSSAPPTKTDNSEFRQRLNLLKYSDDNLATAVIGNRYYHRGLDFTIAFPTGWQVRKGASSVHASGPADGAAIQLNVKKGDPQLSPQQYIETKLGLGTLTDGKTINPGQLPGYTAVQTGAHQRRVAVIYYRERAFVFQASADNPPLKSFYDTLILSSIGSFRPLNEDDKNLALARKIHYLQAAPDMTYAQLASYSPLEEFAEEQLRILNGDYPNGEPVAGEWIKVVD